MMFSSLLPSSMTKKLSAAATSLVLIFSLFSTPGLITPGLIKCDSTTTILPGSAFTDNNGFQAAVDAAPVWLFGRSLGRNPCYPDIATINNGSAPNPGRGPALGPLGPDPNPGDCRIPGPWNGIYSPGASFPNYINAVYCTAIDQWYVTYSLYYVHDGALSLGHRNDWESATVAWGRSANGSSSDFWQRERLILSIHSGHDSYSWNDIQTVDDAADQDESTGQNKTHPKVYVGFFKHPNFPNKKTAFDFYNPLAPDDEFRSDDWYYLPQLADMHASSEIQSDWDYGKAASTPARIDPCSF